MKFFSLIVSGLLCLVLTLSLSAQTPAKLGVPIGANTHNTIATTDGLFEPMRVAGRSAVQPDPVIENYQLLELDAELHTQLLANSPDELALTLPGPAGATYRLALERVYLTAAGFRLTTASGQLIPTPELGAHYRGRLLGHPDDGTHVALSILPDGIQGLIAQTGGNNLVLGPLDGTAGAAPAPGREPYILYEDQPIFTSQDFDCQTNDSGIAYPRDMLAEPLGNGRSNDACVKVYFEVDWDIFQDKGSVENAAAYVTAAFNEVAVLYANINVELSISEIFVWDQFSPYGGSSSGTLLSQFQSNRPTFNGDIAQLLSYQASGGIAVLDGLCHPFSAARMSFSSIRSGFNTVPTYSWTIMVIAHELGHLLGSQHTHACVWNGNSTAIDGCAGFTEGNCGNPGIPTGGGSVMSYCHITSAGIDFNVGFGQQPGMVIFNTINQASCVTADGCGGVPPVDDDDDDDNTGDTTVVCNDNQVFFRLQLDNFGPETTWQLETETGEILAEGGPYPKKRADSIYLDTLCLLEACYHLRIKDEDGDGICCNYGQGSYELRDIEGNLLASGGEFEEEEVTDFCLPYVEPVDNDDCISFNFNENPIISYGINQDAGQYSVRQNGEELIIANNAWKAIELSYNLTAETFIEFEFKSTIEGEIHGFGFDDDLNINPEYTFRVHGTQNWGNGTFDNYAAIGQWQQYIIPIGEYLNGEAAYLFFVADHDLGARNGNSFFRNVRIYEGAPCLEELPGNAAVNINDDNSALEVWPNPAHESLRITAPGPGAYSILNTTGSVLLTGELTSDNTTTISLRDLPTGTYFLRYQGPAGEVSRRFNRLR